MTLPHIAMAMLAAPAAANLWLGVTLLRQGEYRKAGEAYGRAIHKALIMGLLLPVFI